MNSFIRNPKISIGIPVYNGEKYISEAIKAILRQTYCDFELIISDNNSTDGTHEICKKYMKEDDRITYHRNKNNIGAALNYNITFHKSRGKYFKWNSHDDLISPFYLERCMMELETNPEAVLAYPNTYVIDQNARIIREYRNQSKTDSDNPCERFASLLEFGSKCYEIFGLIKSETLRKSPLIGPYSHSDGALLADLSLKGKFININENLFFAREHPEQSMTMIHDYRKYATWFDPRLKNRLLFPYWRIHYEFIRAVNNSEISRNEKIVCYKSIGDCILKRKHLLAREALYPIKYYIRKYHWCPVKN